VSQNKLQPVPVGNDVVVSRPRLQVVPAVANAAVIPIVPDYALSAAESIHVTVNSRAVNRRKFELSDQILEFFHRNSFITFALLFLLVGTSGIQVAGSYLSSRISSQIKATPVTAKSPTISGLNLSVPSAELDARIQSIINQPATLTVGDQAAQIRPETIRSWLQITPSQSKSEYNIHVKATVIAKSLSEMASKYVKAPVDQVSVTHGEAAAVIAGGRNGTRLSDPGTLNSQAAAIAKTLMDSKGLQFSTPLDVVPARSLTPADFDKLIEVNIVTKQMYLYQNGQLTQSYPISAGAPESPTPIGQYKIFSQLKKQDMRGYNADGRTQYFQPNVQWISYFKSGGFAIHGNYWRPASWFGAVNSSHGCVSLPNSQAKEVFDWADIGTTIITHT
jgi:hypothetical protein